MTDAGFVIAAYTVIVGGLALYTLSLWRRLRSVGRSDDEGREKQQDPRCAGPHDDEPEIQAHASR